MQTGSHLTRFHPPARVIFPVLFSLMTGRRRDILKDSRVLLSGIEPSPIYRGLQNIPSVGPMMVTLNHYSRPGFFILWAAAVISAVLPDSSIWLMTAAWTNRTGGLDRLRTWLTRTIFKRLAEIYGLVTMPAMPPVPGDAAERALSIRRLMNKIRKDPKAIACVAPEGMDFPDGVLGAPGPGTGKLLLQAARMLKHILPVGVYEEDQRLVIHFGSPYELMVSDQSADVDRSVSDQVMRRIAALLPEEMRGQYYECHYERL